VGNKIEIPDFLLELSQQMNSDPNRCTSHPFWQVRCKRYLPTADGCNEHHYVLFDRSNDGAFYRSDIGDFGDCMSYLMEWHEEWAKEWAITSMRYRIDSPRETVHEFFYDKFTDVYIDELPECIDKVPMQEAEEVVATHLTQAAAEQFIARKQHDYPPLYTYVESAYWSPQLRELQDWIKSLTNQEK